ncbi:MAG TPA: serine/threonine-protein kinase [Victivallales bacterium]|nr:serine/threonine-protein kinase [Victivallales bacterium]
MWNIFLKKKEKSEKPDLNLLTTSCIECPSCSTVNSILNIQPLTIIKCENCENPLFVPYNIKGFWLYKPLGGGGMSSVYKAFHEKKPELSFAVKILPRDKKNNKYLIDALLREASTGKKFGRHPHLTAVIDYGKYDDEYFSAMEFCEGKRLDLLIEEPTPIPQKLVLLWGLQILSAEQRIYDCGYLFKDLKPQNIIIDPDGNAKLIDYGLCEEIDKDPKEKGDSVEGSPLYMPPERIVGQQENMSSEIYSLGMVMFHALAKKTYYTATGAYELAHKHIAAIRIATVASRMPPHVNPAICELLDKMIARNPSDRIQTYKDAAAKIKTIYNNL